MDNLNLIAKTFEDSIGKEVYFIHKYDNIPNNWFIKLKPIHSLSFSKFTLGESANLIEGLFLTAMKQNMTRLLLTGLKMSFMCGMV